MPECRRAPEDGDHEGPVRHLRYARETVAREAEAGAGVALALLWASAHLDNLRRLELDLVGPAGNLAGHPPEKRTSSPLLGTTRA